MDDLLRFLLQERPAVAAAADTSAFWASTRDVRKRFALAYDRAAAGGRVADRLGYAFASGYEAALHALVPSLPADAVAGFSVTEERGAHPRAVEARLTPAEGGHRLTGRKRWATMAPLADILVVVAKAGEGEDGRPVLRAVRIPKSAHGVTVTEMPQTAFVPEVPHAEIVFEDVRVEEALVLPGDGYSDYVKPFRTVEDLHVNAAVLGYFLSVALRNGWSDALVSRATALLAGGRTLALLDPRRAETHVALAGFLDQARALADESESSWSLVSDSERERWYRDRVLTQVASKARQQRRERAFADLHGDPPK
jgi:alkylation response protein AidB-like acyl-CoA dehydrogenase